MTVQAGGSAAEEGRVLDEGDFPAMGSAGPAPFVPSGYGAAAAGGNVPRAEEFPALPGKQDPQASGLYLHRQERVYCRLCQPGKF